MNTNLSFTLLQVIIFTTVLVSQRHTEAKKHKSSRYWLDGLRHSRKHYNSRENSRQVLYPSLRKYNYFNDYEVTVQKPLHHHSHHGHRQHNYWNEEETVNRLMRHTADKHMHGRSAKNVDTSNTERPTTPLTIRRADFTRVHATLKRIKTFSSSLGPVSRHLQTTATTEEDTEGNVGAENSEIDKTSLKDKTTLENPSVVENSASTQNSVPLNVPTDTTENSDNTVAETSPNFSATETSATATESPTTEENT